MAVRYQHFFLLLVTFADRPQSSHLTPVYLLRARAPGRRRRVAVGERSSYYERESRETYPASESAKRARPSPEPTSCVSGARKPEPDPRHGAIPSPAARQPTRRASHTGSPRAQSADRTARGHEAREGPLPTGATVWNQPSTGSGTTRELIPHGASRCAPPPVRASHNTYGAPAAATARARCARRRPTGAQRHVARTGLLHHHAARTLPTSRSLRPSRDWGRRSGAANACCPCGA